MLGACITLTGGSLDNQWEFVFSNFAVDELYLLGGAEPSSKITKQARRVDCISEIDRPVVVMAPQFGRYVQGEVSLKDFDHPENAVYLFGPDNQHLTLDAEPFAKVYVPTHTKHEMYAHVVAAVTFWDRLTNG